MQSNKNPHRVLSIAGAASGGTAGIQADIKTFQELDTYSWTVITAIVGQHPETGKNIHPLDLEAIQAQFATGLKQIGVDALKTGMLFSKEIIEYIVQELKNLKNIPIVVDPVMIGKLDSVLLAKEAEEALVKKLIPLAYIITPNMGEASHILKNRPLKSIEDLIQAAKDLYALGSKNVLVKGGRLKNTATDVLYNGKDIYLFKTPKIDTLHTSGAGCSFAAAITANLAKGHDLIQSIKNAKSFITQAIKHGFSYNNYIGPTYHAANRKYNDPIEIDIIKI